MRLGVLIGIKYGPSGEKDPATKAEMILSGNDLDGMRKAFKALANDNCGEFDEIRTLANYDRKAKKKAKRVPAKPVVKKSGKKKAD